jgi:hypothetical protein
MCDWAEKNKAQWNHYFLYANLNKITYDIRDGKISPWIMLNSDNGVSALKKLADEQLQTISPMIDLAFWSDRFKTHRSDVEFVKKIILEAGI